MNFCLRIKHFEVPADFLPRYADTRKRTIQFVNRYNKVVHSVGLKDAFQVPTYGIVQVYYIHDETSIDPCIVNFCGTDGERIRCNSLTLNEYMRDLNEIKKYFGSVFVKSINLLERQKKLLGPRTILIRNANEDIQAIEENDTITLTSPDNLQKHIGVLLEREVLSILYERVIILQCLIEIKDPPAAFAKIDEETTLHSKQLFAKQSEKEAVEWDINNEAQLWLKARLTGIKKLIVAQFANASVIFKENVIESMLSSSYSPIKFPETQMCEDLILSRNYLPSVLAASERRRECRLQIFALNIFLDASMSVDEKERTQNDLKRLLNAHKVLKYAFSYEQTEVTQFRKVGSTIKVHNETISTYREGSLGGFAKLGADNETCVLLAKHLADQSTSSCVYIKDYPNAEAFWPFAFVLQPRIPVGRKAKLDIAIAKVIPSELNKCQVRFKDEYGTSLPSTLCLFNDSAWLNGLDVHSWRAGSSPGLGVIVIPTLYVKDMDDTFLKIEDREPELDQQITRFAKEGDSGAVVCANDINRSTVHVLAMLIGSSNHFQVTQDPASKQQYVAFRLSNGLQQLRQEQQNDVALF